MEGLQVERSKKGSNWQVYLLSAVGVIITASVLLAALYFHKQIQDAAAYGLIGVFIIGLLCGISVIPTPVQLLIFTAGAVLSKTAVDPVYVGLVAGFGAAIGGITVYLTGAGVLKVLSKLRPHTLTPLHTTKHRKFMFWTKVQASYGRFVDRLGGKGGSWLIFISSAMIFSPFYFAGLAAGSLRLGLLRFFLLTWAGKTVRYVFIAYAGFFGLQYILKWVGD